MAAKKTAARKPAAVKVYKSFGQIGKAKQAGTLGAISMGVDSAADEVTVTDRRGHVRLRLPLHDAIAQLAGRSGIRFAHVAFDGVAVK